MVQLHVLSRYRNTARQLFYNEDDVIKVSEELADWLLRDAPGCFKIVAEAHQDAEQKQAKIRNRAIFDPDITK